MDEQSDLGDIYSHIQELRLSHNELQNLPALQQILRLKPATKSAPSWLVSRQSLFLLGSVFAVVLLGVAFSSSLEPITRLISWGILKFAPVEAQGEECLLRAPVNFADWFRPPVNCSVCHGIKKIDSVSHISREEFTEKYAYSSLPLVVRGAIKEWTATKAFSFEFFRQLYLKDFPGSLEVLEEHCQFFKYKTEFGNLRDVLTMSKERYEQVWYVGFSNCDVAVAESLRKHYAKPDFLPVGTESSRLDWVFMGRPGYGANLHVDNVGRPSWQAQIRGTKEWTLEPPPECYFECQTLKVTVNPTDIIVVDTDTWYHSTLILGKEISITIGSEYD